MKQHINLSSSPPAPTSRVVLKAISQNSNRKQPSGTVGLKKKRNVVVLSDDSIIDAEAPVSLNVIMYDLTISRFLFMCPTRDISASLMTTKNSEKLSLLN